MRNEINGILDFQQFTEKTIEIVQKIKTEVAKQITHFAYLVSKT